MMRLRMLATLVVAVLVEGVARLGLFALEKRGIGYDPIPGTLPAARTREHEGDWDALGVVRLAKLGLRVVRQANGPLRGAAYNPRSEAFRVAVATLVEFVHEVRAHGEIPVVLLFPQRPDLTRYRRKGSRSYDQLLKALDAAGIRYLDLVEAFEGCRTEDLPALVPSHYSAAANARVAAYPAARLDRDGIRDQAGPPDLPACAPQSMARAP